MYDVKSLILAVHDYAKKTDDPIVQALCHALGQGCSTVHTVKHAIGLPMYEMTAMVKERGIDDLSYLVEMKELSTSNQFYTAAVITGIPG